MRNGRMAMVSMEERITGIEAEQQATNKRMDDFREDITSLRTDMNNGFSQLRSEISQLRTDMNTGFSELRAHTNKVFYIAMGWPALVVVGLVVALVLERVAGG